MKLKKKNNSQGGIEFGSLWDNYKTQDTSKEGIYVYVIYMCKCTEKGLEEEPSPLQQRSELLRGGATGGGGLRRLKPRLQGGYIFMSCCCNKTLVKDILSAIKRQVKSQY